ncbi:MAG: hypothetical protein WD397_01520 [Wenzhouxiangellaceae bacterium]
MKNNLVAPLLVLCTVSVTPLVFAQSTIELEQPDGTVLSIPLDTNEEPAVRINPGTGSLEAKASPAFSCSGDCQISFDGADGGFFIVDGDTSTTVPETGGVTFDWRARGAWQCRGTGLPGTTWSDPGKNPWGPFSVSVSPLEPGTTYQAALECSNGVGNTVVSDTVEIRVQENDIQIPAECEGRQPASAVPTALCELSTHNTWIGSTNCFEYASLFGQEFPGFTGQGKNFALERDTYVALEFSTAGLSHSKGLWTFETPNLAPTTRGPRLMTISQCPGDFDRDAIEAEMGSNCYVRTDTLQKSVFWKQAGTSGARCELDLDKTYYLNMIYTTDPAGTPPAELEWACGSNESTSGCGDLTAPSASN